MIVMLLAFLPDRVVRDRFRGGPDLPRFRFSFNPAVAAHTRAAALAVALDPDNQVRLDVDRAADVPYATGPDGKVTTGAAGTTALAKGLRFLSVVGFVFWIPGVRALLTRRLFPTAGAPASTPAAKPPTPAAR
jgi:hypothetical protein